jgi:nucleoside-diphosphate-sugar epimerase
MSRTVLITGGAGFIGFNLLQTMISGNYADKYIIIDTGITSDTEKLTEYIQNNKYDNINFIHGDCCDTNLVDTIQETYTQIDEIYHLASIASPPLYKKFPLETLDVGYIGTKNMLELCKYYNARFLFASTSEVYGDALVHPQHENYYGNVNCFGARSSYDESKRVGETLCYTYRQLHNLDIKIVRIFNTYGPHMSLYDGRIVTEIIRALLLNTTLKIFGDGTQTRSLCYVDDTVNAILRLMNTDFNEPINVGSDIEISINELVTVCERVYSRNYPTECSNINREYVTDNLDRDDPKVRRPDLTLNRSILGEQSRTPLEVGISKTIRYFSKK